MSGAPFRVFISYAHEDRALRAALEKHLSPLRRDGSIEVWVDEKIVPGKPWKEEIQRALEAADIVLLLIGPDFLASDFCYIEEMTRAVARHDAGEARVVPVLLKPCIWDRAPFAKLQALPEGARPVVEWRPRGKGFLSVAEGLHRVVEDLHLRPPARVPSTIFSVPFARNPYFTGREDVLAKLAEQLKAGGRAETSARRLLPRGAGWRPTKGGC